MGVAGMRCVLPLVLLAAACTRSAEQKGGAQPAAITDLDWELSAIEGRQSPLGAGDRLEVVHFVQGG